jgi:hypothetical protein
MKPTVLILALFVVVSPLVYGQGFVGKTNEVKLDFKKGVPNTSSLPVINWVTPGFEYTNSKENQINIDVLVSSANPLKTVHLIIGDNTSGNVLAQKNIELTDNKSAAHVKQQIKLPNGSNFIRISAENTDGAIASGTRTVVVGMDAVALSIDRKDYALLFATDKYDHWDDLVNPIEDARALARELKEKYNFEVELIENPESDNVFEKIREYNQRKYKPQDQLMVFFAGHGNFDETFGEGYVVAKNSLMNDKAKSSYISHNRLRGIINNIPCEHILLAMDVCFGGTLDPEIARSRSIDSYESTVTEMVVRKLSQKTRKYLTSGGKEYVSDGIPGKHSPFASKFIESLRSSGGTDRVLTLQELITNMEVLKQVPRAGSFGDDQKQSDFVFISKQ